MNIIHIFSRLLIIGLFLPLTLWGQEKPADTLSSIHGQVFKYASPPPPFPPSTVCLNIPGWVTMIANGDTLQVETGSGGTFSVPEIASRKVSIIEVSLKNSMGQPNGRTIPILLSFELMPGENILLIPVEDLYVGYDEGGQLTEAVRRKPYSVILLDEIEKAHPDVFNVLLQVLDDGRLTDNKGRTADFKNTILIMTSNLKPDEIKVAMRPEFLNRIDEIITFDALTPDNIREIVRIQMSILQKKLEEEGVELTYTKAFEDSMVENGYDPVYGARPVKRLIQRELVNKLARAILEGTVHKSSAIEVDCGPDGAVLLRNK